MILCSTDHRFIENLASVNIRFGVPLALISNPGTNKPSIDETYDIYEINRRAMLNDDFDI